LSLTGLAVLLAGGGAVGLLAAMVLTIDRIRLLQDPTTQLACNISPFIACGPVMQSRAGELFGFPNPLLGIIGFTVCITSGAALLAGGQLRRWYYLGLQAGVVAAAVFITWLQTQSLYVIHALCLWCILVWITTIPIVVAVTVHNLSADHLGHRLTRLGVTLTHYQGHHRRRLVPAHRRSDRAQVLPRVRPAVVRRRLMTRDARASPDLSALSDRTSYVTGAIVPVEGGAGAGRGAWETPARPTQSAVDDHLVAHLGLAEQTLDAGQVAYVDAPVRGPAVAAGGEVG